MKKAIITIGLVVLLVNGSTSAVVDFNDGGYHLIDYVINDGVNVDYDTPYAGTQLEIASGGWIKQSLNAHGTSRITINGGNAENIIAIGDVRVVMYSGLVVSILAGGNDEVEIHGGEITEGIGIGNNGSAIITDGIIGVIGVDDGSHIIMSGGTILEDIGASWNGLVTLIGTDFQVNGHNVGYGDSASTWATSGIDPWGHPWLTGTVTGILENGDTINNNFVFYYQGDITFIPEPATLLILMAGAFIIRNQKRN
jgi:hypothetical protein